MTTDVRVLPTAEPPVLEPVSPERVDGPRWIEAVREGRRLRASWLVMVPTPMTADTPPRCMQRWNSTGWRCTHPVKWGLSVHGSASWDGYCGVHIRGSYSDSDRTVIPWTDLSPSARGAIREASARLPR